MAHQMNAHELFNEQCIAEIKASIQRKSLVVISGTGVSVQSVKDPKVDGFDIVSWKGLLLHGIHRCEGLGLIDGTRAEQLRARLEWKQVVEMIQVAEVITMELTNHSPGVYQRWLADTFSKLEIGSPRLIDALSRIANIYATLNYDSLAEKRLSRASVTWKDSFNVDVAIDGLKVEAGGKPLDAVLHLHGYWQAAESVVFGTKSYEAVVQHTHAQAVQRVFAAGKTMLLVGCGGTLTDPNFKQFFDACGKILAETGRLHFVLCREEEEEAFLGKMPWLRPVIYGKDYPDLAPFVEMLGDAVGEPASVEIASALTPPSDSTFGEEWLKATLKINPELLTTLLLSHRQAASDGLEKVANGSAPILGLQTRFPRSMIAFIGGHLAKKQLLEKPEAHRWVIVRDVLTWQRAAARTDQKLILVAHPTLAFEASRGELAPLAYKNGHAIVYPTLLGRADDANVIPLREPSPSEVVEILAQHGITRNRAQQLATHSNGNLPLLLRELAGTPERPIWAKEEQAGLLRPLALLGGWKTNTPADLDALSSLIGSEYDSWTTSLLPVFHGEEPPFVRTVNEFTAVSRYENWQLLGPYLTDQDLDRFAHIAIRVLNSDNTKFDLPESERPFAGIRGKTTTYSDVFRRGIAETVALIAGKQEVLTGCTPGKPREIAFLVVHGVLAKADWKRWASLGSLLSLLAEADPDTYLKVIESDLLHPGQSVLKSLFSEVQGGIFGGFYQSGLLWSLEVLAWNPDCLNRVALVLADLDQFPLPENMMNRPINSLRAIFLPWLPQTAADISGRKTAISTVVAEYPAVAWKLLLELLPHTHSVGNYAERPTWRDWIPADFKERPSPEDQNEQYRSFAEMAVAIATLNLDRLKELLDHLAKLPPAAFSAILDGLPDSLTKQLSERERLPFWQKLVREAQRHRRFADTNWALPDWAVKKIEKAAEAIAPLAPEIRNQYWFNFQDHELFETEDYEADLKKVAAAREKALTEVLSKTAIAGVLKFATEVAHPGDVGVALGLIANEESDSFLLPGYLGSPDQNIVRVVAGFVKARYWKSRADWLARLPLNNWSPEQLGLFFSELPFQQDVWEAAETALGNRAEEYWKHVNAFPRGSPAELLAGLKKLVEHNRGISALHSINNLIRSKSAVPAPLAMRTIYCYLDAVAKTGNVDAYELVNVVEYLQKDPASDRIELGKLEWLLLDLFDGHHGHGAVVLEDRLASEPEFFAEVMQKCFKARNQLENEVEPDNARRAEVRKGYKLLHDWGKPPGTKPDGKFDVAALNDWVDKVKERCTAMDRWEAAELYIGNVLVYAPNDPDGLWLHRGAAALLNTKAYEVMRRGFTTEIFNSRGAHFSDGGKAERDLAASYKAKGKQLDDAGFARIAAAMYELAESYVRMAEREEKQIQPGD
jgi:hypothetical protein